MGRFLRLSIVVTALLLTMACFLTQCGNGGNNNIIDPTPTVVSLTVLAQPNVFNAVGQVINLSYTVANTGTARLAGPVSIMDDRAIVVTCPSLNTIGNKNGELENGETVICTGGYTITQADISGGSVTDRATATVGGQSSNTVVTTINAQLNRVLTIAVTANPLTYSAANQTITYTYVVTNAGPTPLGPAQFVVSDNKIPASINCGANNTTLAPNQTVTCTSAYTTTATDMSSSSIANTAIATGAGAGTIQPAGAVVTNSVITPVPGGNPNYTRGSTVQHQVQPGEWLLQISRCYGANYDAVRRANPAVKDPNVIFPIQVVTVPNIGSDGSIYGPQNCVVFYTVVSGDTWQTIANKYNADIDVLRAANPGVTLSAGVKVKVPNNSRQSGTPYPTPIPLPTVTAQPTTIPIKQPIRITFQPGNPATYTHTSTIGMPDTLSYVFNASAGQVVNIRLTVPTNDVSFAVYGPGNVILKPLDSAMSWSGTLTATGDHFINLVSSIGAATKSYTLDVSLTTPVVTPTTNSEQVLDIYPGSGSSNPSYLVPFNGQLYFQATGNDNAGAELWKYDRAPNVASRVADIYPGTPGSEPTYLRPYKDNMLYFTANGNDGAGRELWRFNGSAAGRVNDLFSGPEGSNPSYLTEFNGMLYFSANGNDGAGIELWRFDGTTSTRAADINPGPGNSNPSYLTVYNNALYFSATTTNGGTELWKFDGTNPSIAADITPGIGNGNPSFLVLYNNVLYFSANGNNGAGTELWKFDGTTPSMAYDINPGAADSAPTYMTVFNNAIFFSAVGNGAGFELWKYDGNTASMAADINPAGDSKPAYLGVYNNELYFQATGSNTAGAELWRYRGP